MIEQPRSNYNYTATVLHHIILCVRRKYEDLACQILSDCDESDRTTVEDVRSILLRILPNWGNLTCLDLADTALCQNFLSHHVVQSLMRHIWKHGLSERKVLYFSSCCFLMFFLLLLLLLLLFCDMLTSL